jgi:hypothetical protein
MAKLLSDSRYAVTGQLVSIDATGLVGPFFTIRVPAKGYDLHRPATYIDLTMLDPGQVVFKKKVHINDEIKVIINPSTALLEGGTRNELTFEIMPRTKAQRVSHAIRRDNASAPINGKVIDTDERRHVVVDAGLPLVVGLLDAKPAQVKLVKINSWVTFWPAPPTHGIILAS